MTIEVVKARRKRGRSDGCPRRHVWLAGERGQASVSFVAAVPLLLLLGMGCIQAVLAGHASVAASHAARAAARAEYAGEDTERAATAALPAALRESIEVSTGGGAARVSLSAPRVLPFGPSIPVRSEAKLGPSAEGSGG